MENQKRLRLVLGEKDCFTDLISRIYRYLVVSAIERDSNVIIVSFSGGCVNDCLEAITAFVSKGEVVKAHLVE